VAIQSNGFLDVLISVKSGLPGTDLYLAWSNICMPVGLGFERYNASMAANNFLQTRKGLFLAYCFLRAGIRSIFERLEATSNRVLAGSKISPMSANKTYKVFVFRNLALHDAEC
jgi:hypothetical protein